MAKKETKKKKANPGKTEARSRKLYTPHDRVFRFVLRKPERAASLIRAHLPKKYCKHLELDSIEAFTTEVIDDELDETKNDLVFKVKLADHDVYVFPVLEHQSDQPGRSILRFANYALRLMGDLLGDPSDKFSLPIIIVVNQGPRPWAPTVSLHDHFDVPDECKALLDFALQFRYLAIDLPDLADDEISDDPAVRLTLGLMRAVAKNEVATWLREHLTEFEKVDNDDELIRSLLTYVNHTDHDLLPETVENLAQQVHSGKLRGEFMTLAEKFEKRGEARGEARGETKGQISVLATLICRRFEADSVADWRKELAKLKSSRLGELTDSFWKFETAEDLRKWISERSESHS